MLSRDEHLDKLVKQRIAALKQEEHRIEDVTKKLSSKNMLKRLMIKNEPFWNFNTTHVKSSSFLKKLFIVDEEN